MILSKDEIMKLCDKYPILHTDSENIIGDVDVEFFKFLEEGMHLDLSILPLSC